MADRSAGRLSARRQVGQARREDRLALRGSEAGRRPEPGPRAGVRLPGLSDHRRGAALRRRQAGGGCGHDYRRARRLSAQRERADPLSALRILSPVRGRVRKGRPRRARLQRQAPLLQLREGEVDGGGLEALEVPDAGGLVAAGDLAAAGYRTAAGLRDRRCADGGRRRIRSDGLSTRWRRCSAWWSGGGAARRASNRCR